MPNRGIVSSLWVTRQKGTPGFNTVKAHFIAGSGIEGDIHCGDGPRQVSIMAGDAYRWIDSTEEKGLCLEKFKANILLDEIDFEQIEPGMLLRIGPVVLKITEKNKLCFSECELLASGRECRLSFGCCFAEVLRGGKVESGEKVIVDTASNRVSDSRAGTAVFQERLKKVEEQTEPADVSKKTAKKIGRPSINSGDSVKKNATKMESKEAVDEQALERYARQIMIGDIGEEGQKRLFEASVLVIGAGGLGNAIITALAAAGVGCIGIADGDKISWSNLNRQFLYTPEDLGRKKTICSAQWLKRFRPDSVIKVYDFDLTSPSLNRTIHNYDLVLLAVDNLKTRLMVNRVARNKHIPLIDGAIEGYYGMITPVLNDETPCLECLHGADPSDYGDENKKISALGTTAMIVGAMQAQLAIRYLIGNGRNIVNIMYSFDGTRFSLDEIPIEKNGSCHVCGQAD